MSLNDLRKSALDIFQHSLSASDSRAATREAVVLSGDVVRVHEREFDVEQRPVYVVALGKAALSMALGLNDVLETKIAGAVISTARLSSAISLPPTQKLFYGGHPLPNQQSLEAAIAAFALLDQANKEEALVIFLVSGGGSAMLERPISTDITLEDLQETNRQLIACGATITEINAVRRSLSAVKGGALAAYVHAADVVTLIVSDTNIGDEASVASGPTLAPSSHVPDPLRVIEQYGLAQSLPAFVLKAIGERKKKTDLPHTPFYVLLDNRSAISAAAQRATKLGFATTIAFDINEQPVDKGSNLLLDRVSQSKTVPSCLISGGEFSCRISGSGMGGRNLETVLRCAIQLDQDSRQNHTVVLSAGTDGIDGSSFSAGAIADEATISRALQLGLAPADYLQRSDSHAFFEALGDLIVTGPTGTNVRDLRLVLCDE